MLLHTKVPLYWATVIRRRTDNTMSRSKKNKRISNDLQHTTQKTKDRATPTPLNSWGELMLEIHHEGKEVFLRLVWTQKLLFPVKNDGIVLNTEAAFSYEPWWDWLEHGSWFFLWTMMGLSWTRKLIFLVNHDGIDLNTELLFPVSHDGIGLTTEAAFSVNHNGIGLNTEVAFSCEALWDWPEHGSCFFLWTMMGLAWTRKLLFPVNHVGLIWTRKLLFAVTHAGIDLNTKAVFSCDPWWDWPEHGSHCITKVHQVNYSTKANSTT